MSKVASRQQNSSKFTSVTCRYGSFIIYCLLDDDDNIIHLTFNQKGHQKVIKKLASLDHDAVILTGKQQNCTFNQLFADYFAGNLTQFPLKTLSPFIISGTEFQQKVWQQIAKIPYGQTRTYKELARTIGNPGSVRALGSACGANPLALLIPCHRVVGVNGLGGFAGGIHIKKKLLELEKTG